MLCLLEGEYRLLYVLRFIYHKLYLNRVGDLIEWADWSIEWLPRTEDYGAISHQSKGWLYCVENNHEHPTLLSERVNQSCKPSWLDFQ